MVSSSDRPPTRLLTTLSRRALAAVGTMWAAATIAFFALRLAGGDPTQSLVAQGLASAEQAAALRAELGLDAPLLDQYARFLVGLIQGNLGESLYTRRPVVTTIAEQLPSTLALAAGAIVVSLLIGTSLGIVAGWRPETLLGRAADAISAMSTGIPVAVAGILALLAAAAAARVVPSVLFLTRAGNVALPAVTLGFATSGALARAVQAGLADSRSAPFIVAARARGIPPGWRLLWHALRPALPVAVSLAALQAAFLLSGTVVTETVFSRPGLGRLLVSSILQGDFPVVQGLVVLAAILYTTTQAIADGLAVILDPRLGETS
ncbi:MAG TPA: ABC transporter permease [Anaerolineales bacterium]|nr:ABC transporter permease [Anaerolineales bacterium]